MREVAAELPKEASGCQPGCRLPGCQLLGEAGANTEVTEVTEVNSKEEMGFYDSPVFGPRTSLAPDKGLVPLAARFEVYTARVEPSHLRQDFWDQRGVIERPCANF